MSAILNSNSGPVLLIDDSVDIREAFQMLMEFEGFQVIAMGSASQALDFLREDKIKPRIIILDLNMPEMDGREFLNVRNSEGLAPGVPIIVFSAHRQTEVLPGTVGWAKKPIDIENLLSLIEKHAPER